MPLVKFKITSTKFRDELNKRVASFRNARIAARIQVDSDVKWWYWLEFGTAGRQDPLAPIRSTQNTYPIDPVHMQSLAWPEGGTTKFADHVNHPGIRPHPFIRGQLGVIMRYAANDLGDAMLKGGFRASNVKAQLLESTMPFALQKIVEALEVVAPGTREDGKLQGNTAAESFEEEAQIVDASDMMGNTPLSTPTSQISNTHTVQT